MKNKNKIKIFFRRHWYLFFLVVFLWATRLPVIMDGVIPFGFDHGKDSLAIIHMWLAKELKFVGPWTSIPGLYFGPAWYYLLLLFYVVGKGNPVIPILALVMLHSMFLVLAYKYFGKLAATIFCLGATWFTITQSAWNPFPMPLISLLIIIVLLETQKRKKISNLQALLLGIFSALGFHFSTAYAIFYPVIVALTILLKKIKFNIKNFFVYCVGFILPLIPQILFELKNNFIQTKGVLKYITEGESQVLDWQKVLSVVTGTFKELQIGFLPEIWLPNQNLTNLINVILKIFVLLLLIWGVYLLKRKQKKELFLNLVLDFVIWIVMPMIAFIFLHFNFWYLLGMMPMAVILVVRLLNQTPKKIRLVFVSIFFLTCLSKIFFYYTEDRTRLENKRAFLPVKMETIAYIRKKAGDKPFAVYHYVPDIYDFSYQYLYFQQAWQGQKLPVDFSYQPNVVPYIGEKPDLLKVFKEKNLADERQPELVFYVVEKPEVQAYLDEWWQQQNYQEIVNEKKISEEVTVYEGRIE